MMIFLTTPINLIGNFAYLPCRLDR
ncbi:uncharacterized protein METZ01_LOCUS410355, partial [marine metagenome]